MAKDGHQVLLPPHFHAQDAKSILLVVKGHPLDKAGKNLLFVLSRHELRYPAMPLRWGLVSSFALRNAASAFSLASKSSGPSRPRKSSKRSQTR